MCRRIIVSAILAISIYIAPVRGAVIPFDHPKKDALLGVKINPTGPQDAPLGLNLFDSIGVGFGLVAYSPAAKYYSANATFRQPIESVTMTIENIDPGDWNNDFTLVAFDESRRVGRTDVRLARRGDATQITLAAAEIDKVKWFGDGWTFHPYIVSAMNVTFEATSVPISPQVGSAPEPGFLVIVAPILMFALLQRRRRNSGGRASSPAALGTHALLGRYGGLKALPRGRRQPGAPALLGRPRRLGTAALQS